MAGLNAGDDARRFLRLIGKLAVAAALIFQLRARRAHAFHRQPAADDRDVFANF